MVSHSLEDRHNVLRIETVMDFTEEDAIDLIRKHGFTGDDLDD